MTTVTMVRETDRNPRTIEECRSFVACVESLFMPWNVDALVDGFTEDCIVRFGIVPEFRGARRFAHSSWRGAPGRRDIA